MPIGGKLVLKGGLQVTSQGVEKVGWAALPYGTCLVVAVVSINGLPAPVLCGAGQKEEEEEG